MPVGGTICLLMSAGCAFVSSVRGSLAVRGGERRLPPLMGGRTWKFADALPTAAPLVDAL
jgi:hypothetical protein